MNVGAEWLVDAEGCLPELLSDARVLRRVCEHMRVIGQGVWHEFPPPGGVTGLFLLTESHLACHTYPESGIATFNLYCCRERPTWPWVERLKEWLGARTVTVRHAARGAARQELAQVFETASVGEENQR
jgi:S-adenosylmethionine decarboxylase